jgi:hypothetical protein
VRPAVGPEEEGLDRALRYWAFADRFGWTMQEVDAQPAAHLRRLLVIEDVVGALREENHERQKRSIGG